jgi:hypothetical protein
LLAPPEASLLALARRYHPVAAGTKPLIRLGGDQDGGYLLPDDLVGIDYCLSPGVSDVANFEADLAARGIQSHLADASVDGPPAGFTSASFTKRFIGATNHADYVTLADWMQDTGAMASDELVLQMDIEGAEYAALLATPEHVLQKFRIIIIELHNLQALANRPFFEIFSEFTTKLLKNHAVVHLHPNNNDRPVIIRGVRVNPVLEVTLLRKDRLGAPEQGLLPSLPNPLDRRNNPSRMDVDLSPNWYQI